MSNTSSKVFQRKKSAISRTRNLKFTSVFSTLETNPQFKGSLGEIADKVIHRGEVISDLNKRRGGPRPATAINPRVTQGFKTYNTLIEVQQPQSSEPIVAFDILSEHTKFLNHILANKLLFREKVTGITEVRAIQPPQNTLPRPVSANLGRTLRRKRTLVKKQAETEPSEVEIVAKPDKSKAKDRMIAHFMEIFSRACVMMLK